MSRFAAALVRPRALTLSLLALAASTALLSGCGGGDRKSFFTPASVVAFGDENSAIVASGGDFTYTLVQNGSTSAVSGGLPGLTFTAKNVVVVQDSCADQGTSPPALCPSGSSTADFDTNTSAAVFDAGAYSFFSIDSVRATTTRIERKASDGSIAARQRTATTYHLCNSSTVWPQIVARAYGLGFNSQCPADNRGGAISHAALGAKTGDVIQQINTHRASLGKGVIATVMVGQNDILEMYSAINANANAMSEATAIDELQRRADAMAAAVKDIIATGAKVALALTPDLGEAPLVATGSAQSALLRRLTLAYNERLYVRGLGNVSGRDLAGVNPDAYTNESTRSTAYVHSTALCNASAVRRPDGSTPASDDDKLKYCNSQHYVGGGSTDTYIWADATRPAPLLHSLIGSLAYNRAREQF